MRLVGGESGREGRLEILRRGWTRYTVCGRLWSAKNTAVVCRYLGFSDNANGRLTALLLTIKIVLISESSHFLSKIIGRSYGPILRDIVRCKGSELKLLSYSYSDCKEGNYIKTGPK